MLATSWNVAHITTFSICTVSKEVNFLRFWSFLPGYTYVKHQLYQVKRRHPVRLLAHPSAIHWSVGIQAPLVTQGGVHVIQDKKHRPQKIRYKKRHNDGINYIYIYINHWNLGFTTPITASQTLVVHGSPLVVRVVGEVVEGTSTADDFDTDALGEVGRGLGLSGLPTRVPAHWREVFYVCAATSYSDDAFLEASYLPAVLERCGILSEDCSQHEWRVMLYHALWMLYV